MKYKIAFLTTCLLFASWLSAQVTVWPGDVNQNGVVNNIDLLPIGLAYNFFGPERDSIATDWAAQEADPWNFSFPGNINFANADCNGDGIINYFYDAFPIYVHYGNTHGTVTPDVFQTGLQGIDPPLYFDSSQLVEPVLSGGVIHLPLMLGTEDIPVENLYGIAFSIHVDPLVFDVDQTQIDFSQLSWSNPDQDRIFSVYRASSSRLDVSWVRTDRNDKSGAGFFANTDFIIIDDVVTLQKPGTIIRIDSIKMIDRFSNETTVAGSDLYIELSPNAASGTTVPAEKPVTISPNPATDYLYISAPEPVESAVLYDIAGAQIADIHPGKTGFSWQPGVLPDGIYYCEIQTGKTVARRKVAIHH